MLLQHGKEFYSIRNNIPTRLSREIGTLLLWHISAHLLGNIVTGLACDIHADSCWNINTVFDGNVFTDLTLNWPIYINFQDIITNASLNIIAFINVCSMTLPVNNIRTLISRDNHQKKCNLFYIIYCSVKKH